MEYLENANYDCSKIRSKILTINDRNFYKSIIDRGNDYYRQGKVKELKRIDDETYTTKVVGKDEYTVVAKMRGQFCVSAECTCPFNEVDEGYINAKLCKHIYATYLAIYEVENRDYLKNMMKEYKSKYCSLYLKIIEKIDKINLNSNDKSEYKKYKREWNKLQQDIENDFIVDLNSKEYLDILCEYITESAKILDLLNKMYVYYENETERIAEEIDENDKKEVVKQEETWFVKLLKAFGMIITGIFIGIFSSNETENNNEEKEFSFGDTVMIKRNGKVGVIVDSDGSYHTVKLKDENENEYYESFYSNELEKY